MKKMLLSIVAPFAFFAVLSAETISQEEADGIVWERLSQETQSYTVYAKEDVQKEMTITTSTGEVLEINYFCWVYYIRCANANQGRYLIIKENNGNLLEVKAKGDIKPNDLTEWREVPYDCESAQRWDYPVKPGMEEWKNLLSLQEKVDICQIPENILLCLSTENLTNLCLQYPLLYDIFAFSCYSAGFDRVFYEFNGIRELFEREKTSAELLKHYNGKIQDMSILDDPTTPDLEKGYFMVSISALEVLLCGYSQKVDATRETYIEILRCLTVGYEKKLEYTDYFKGTGFVTNFFARANIIFKITPESIHTIPSAEILCGSQFGIQNSTSIINELSYQLIQ